MAGTGYTNDGDVVIHPWPRVLRPNGQQLDVQSHSARFEAPFSRATQTQELPGGRFTLSVSLPPMKEPAQRVWRAFRGKLRGSAGYFYFRAELVDAELPVLGAAEPAAAAVPLTADSTLLDADSTRITADATEVPGVWPATCTGDDSDPTMIFATSDAPTGWVVLEAGRHVSFDGPSGWRRLHLLLEDAVVLPGGTVAFEVTPPLKEYPLYGAPLHLINPSGVFQLVDDNQGGLAVTLGRVAETAVDAVEANPPRFTVGG